MILLAKVAMSERVSQVCIGGAITAKDAARHKKVGEQSSCK